MNYQKLILVGNATRDAERKTAKNSKISYTTFRVGVRDGKDRTIFFPITVFGKSGESVAEYVKKGREVVVEGRIQMGENGRLNVIADQVKFGSACIEK